HAAGMLALDVARVEAGLLLIEVDYSSSKKALISSQKYSPYELGFEKMVHLQKENFVGKAALERDHKQGVPRQLVGLEIDWNEAADGDHNRSHAAECDGTGGEVAVLQSGEKDGGAGLGFA